MARNASRGRDHFPTGADLDRVGKRGHAVRLDEATRRRGGLTCLDRPLERAWELARLEPVMGDLGEMAGGLGATVTSRGGRLLEVLRDRHVEAPALDAALTSGRAKNFFTWARFPHAALTPGADVWEVQLDDLRFAGEAGQPRMFVVRIQVSQQLELVGEEITFSPFGED